MTAYSIFVQSTVSPMLAAFLAHGFIGMVLEAGLFDFDGAFFPGVIVRRVVACLYQFFFGIFSGFLDNMPSSHRA